MKASVLQKSKSRRFVLPGILALVMILFATAIIFGARTYNDSVREDFMQEADERKTLERKLLAVSESDHVYGPSSAPIKLILYSDAHCQYCRYLYPRLKKLVHEYPAGTVALVYRHIPIYKTRNDISTEEIAGECVEMQAGDPGFFMYIDALYGALPPGERLDRVPTDLISASANTAGADTATTERCIAEEYGRAVIEKHHSSGGALGVITIPHTFIVTDDEAYELVGDKPTDTYRTIIDSLQ